MRFWTLHFILAISALLVVAAPAIHEAGPIVFYEVVSGHRVVVRGDVYEIHTCEGLIHVATRDDFRAGLVAGTFAPMYVPPIQDQPASDGPLSKGAHKPG